MLLALALTACAGGITDYEGAGAPRFVPWSGSEPPRLALVLGAGGPRGFAHIGVLKVLAANGIEPDLVVGASVGAMIGALYANGMSATELEKIALELDPKKFIGVDWSGFKGSGAAVASFVNDYLGGKPIEGLKRRLAITAATTRDNTLVIFNHGDAGAAARASSATPGQFNPVRILGVEFHDGDEATPVPIRAARQLGARIVIAVDVSAYVSAIPAEAPGSWAIRDRSRAAKIESEKAQADVFIHPDLGYYAGISDPYRRMCIERGEAAATAALPAIRAALAKAASAGR
jgi:NTE family protein